MQMISVIFSEERYSYKVSLVLLQGKVQKKNGASVKAFKRSNDPKFQLLILISYRTRSFILNSKTFFTEWVRDKHWLGGEESTGLKPTWNSVLDEVVSELPAAVSGYHCPNIGQGIEEVGRPEARENLGALASVDGVVGDLRDHLRRVLGYRVVETDWERKIRKSFINEMKLLPKIKRSLALGGFWTMEETCYLYLLWLEIICLGAVFILFSQSNILGT